MLPTRRCCSATRWRGCGYAVPAAPTAASPAPVQWHPLRFQVIGINQEGIPTFGGGTGEPRENENARILRILCSDIFLRH